MAKVSKWPSIEALRAVLKAWMMSVLSISFNHSLHPPNHLKTCALFLSCGTYCCQSVWRWKRCTVGVGTWSELPQKNSETAWCLPSTAAGRVWWCLWQRVHAATRREVGGGSWRCFGGTVQWSFKWDVFTEKPWAILGIRLEKSDDACRSKSYVDDGFNWPHLS